MRFLSSAKHHDLVKADRLWMFESKDAKPIKLAGQQTCACADRRSWNHKHQHTGMEAVAGQWSYSLLTITRRIGPSDAGICVASFWISLTAGLFAIGAIANRVRSDRLLQVGIAFAGAGGILLSLDRGLDTALTALVVLGLGLAPLSRC